MGVGLAIACGTGAALFFKTSAGSGAARSASATGVGRGTSFVTGSIAFLAAPAEPRSVTVEREARCTRSLATGSALALGASVRLIVLGPFAELPDVVESILDVSSALAPRAVGRVCADAACTG